MLELDKPREECGVFGVYAPGEDVANIVYFGLSALQHRGQESAGIAVSHLGRLSVTKGMGLVSQVFDESALEKLPGELGIGHTRYSTTGSVTLGNAQPMRFEHPSIGPFLIAHNGNLTNAGKLRDELSSKGASFEFSSDTEVLGKLIGATSGDDLVEVLKRALPDTKAAYCLLFLTGDRLVAVRDSLGIRPLCLGRLGDLDAPGGAGYIVASESAALDIVGAELVRDVEPGEIVSVSARGLESSYLAGQQGPSKNRAMCSFEFIYFARPDSVMMGRSLYEARVAMGHELGREAPVAADIVITLPDSGTPAALGYVEATGIRFVEGMIKSRYVTRTFIQPSQHLRDSDIRLKFNPMRHVVGGRRVIVVDDSIVRGTTSRRLVEEIRRAGASEVHMRIASPPLAWPCFMGIDIASRNELIAAHHDETEIASLLGADSLRYLSIAGLRRAVGRPEGDGFCFACFTGQYPVPVPERLEADKLALNASPRA